MRFAIQNGRDPDLDGASSFWGLSHSAVNAPAASAEQYVALYA